MRVLFIGGSGLISTASTVLALDEGIDLYLLNRGQTHKIPPPPGAHMLVGDANNAETLRQVADEHQFDVIVNWVGFTSSQIVTHIDCFAGRTGQYLFISSASAYQKPASHYLITEDTPLANPHWQYSRDKIACEERLLRAYREQGFPITIVRPSLTYGLTQIPVCIGSWNQPWTIVERMRRGKKIIVPGDGTSLWTVTHNSDFAKGLVGLLGHQQAIGHAFHITSDEVLTWNQIYTEVGRAAGVEPDLIHIASDALIAFAPEDEGGLLGDKSISVVFDNSKIKRFVPDYVATTSFARGIRETLAWFEADTSRCAIDATANAKWDVIIDSYQAALPAVEPTTTTR